MDKAKMQAMEDNIDQMSQQLNAIQKQLEKLKAKVSSGPPRIRVSKHRTWISSAVVVIAAAVTFMIIILAILYEGADSIKILILILEGGICIPLGTILTFSMWRPDQYQHRHNDPSRSESDG